jgi:2-methylisocitrate lyase-like PEP mutase family enzyme
MNEQLEQGSAGARLRALLTRREPTLALGAFDALSARVAVDASFDAVYMTGFGTSAALLGQPDVGLLTQTEMVTNAHHIADAIRVPLIADADTGYGNPLNVRRTVREYEAAGVAAIHLEDQVTPKKCGHMEGKRVIPSDEMVAKIRAAVEARYDPDFFIIARTDARSVEGLASALARAESYRDAGADMLFVEAPESMEEIEAVATHFRGVPLLYNWIDGGKSPPISYRRLQELGFQLIIFPTSLLFAATQAMRAVAAQIRDAGSPLPLIDALPTFQEFTDFIGLPDIKEIERRYGVDEGR